MPTIIDPQYRCSYTWNTRRDSMVDMVNKIFLPEGEIDLNISIHRSLLYVYLKPVDENPYARMRAGFALSKLFGSPPTPDTDLLSPAARETLDLHNASQRWKQLSFSKEGLLRLQRLNALFFSPKRLAEDIAIGLETLAGKDMRRGRDLVSGPILETHNRGAKLSIAYESWLKLKAFFRSPASDEKDRIEMLSSQILLLFLSSSILERIIKPAPRGHRAGKQALGEYLPQACFACRELVRMSKGRQELEHLIKSRIESFAMMAPNIRSYWNVAQHRRNSYRDQITVVCLLYRAFFGAWQLHNMDGLPEPRVVFRRYLYGKRHRELGSVAMLLKSALGEEALITNWIRLYLDASPGSAAKAYGLIPVS